MAEPQVANEKSESSRSMKESDITPAIKQLQEESLQVSELSEMEKSYGVEVISYVKQLIEPVGVSFRVNPASISKSDSSLADVVLTPQGMVCLTYNSGLVSSRSLESLQTETLVKILLEVLPQLSVIFAEKREKLSGRVGMLEKMVREFRKIAVVPVQKKQSSSSYTQNYVQPTIREKSQDRNQDAMKSALAGQ
ncbi:MAG: hypothetical protein JRN15_04040 [Nitrososphaerota archaeon]|nr:hypothetical protein [Nitrososphaerota archaeon]